MAIPTKKLLELLAPEQPADLRLAAVRVLKALGEKDGDVGSALLPLLDEADPALKLEAVQTLGQIRHRPALPALLSLIEHGGPAGEAAAYAVAGLGEKGLAALHVLMPKVAPGIRRYLGAALASVASATAERLSVLQDKDAGVVEAALRSLQEQLPAQKPTAKKEFFEQLLKLAGQTKPPLSAATELAVLRLLAALDDPKAAKAFWPRLAPEKPAEVRAVALQTLGAWLDSATPEQCGQLFRCALDQDFRIASLAQLLLRKLPTTKENQKRWLELLQAPDVSVRRLALEKLGDLDSKEAAEALAQQLRHPDQPLRDAALARLVRWTAGRKLLAVALLKEDSSDRLWALARPLSKHFHQFPSEARKEVFRAACAFLEKDDRRADPLFYVLREADPKELRELLEEKAEALRKKKCYGQALHYLKLMARDPALGFPLRFEMAGCGLKVSPQELNEEARKADPCLHQFALLAQQDEAALVRAIDQAKWIEPDDLYYLGFHFSEMEKPYWRLASELLERVVKRAPKSKTAQAAKAKLKRAGLA